MAKFNFDSFEKNLPDAFRKDVDSNNYKLLLVDKHIYDAIVSIYQSIYDAADIDKATGVALDVHGARKGVKRGTSTDEQYRIRIKGKIAQSLCDGSRDSVAKALAYILSSDTSKVKITSGDKTGYAKLIEIPLELLLKANFTPDEINDLINSLLPEGVELTTTNYTGTFEFSADDSEYNENAGFADMNGTIGGFFGLLQQGG